METKVNEKIICFMFGIIGIIFFIVGSIFWIQEVKFEESAIKTEGTVVEVSSKKSDDDIIYKIYVTYKVDDKIFESSFNSSKYMNKGTNVNIYYDQNNPANISQIKVPILGIIFTMVGLIFIIGTIIVLVIKAKHKNKKKELMLNGQKIYFDYKEVVLNTSYTVNNRNPYNIICSGIDPMTGQSRIFKSENIWEDPKMIIINRNINKFPIYIDTKNRNNYYFSLEEIEPYLK